MMRKKLVLVLMSFLVARYVYGQDTPIIIQAESGTLGANFGTASDAGVDYITVQTALVNGAFPGAGRTVSYSITFPQAGTYDLYVRMRVGPAQADDDSFFYGNGFGVKAIDVGDDWIISNNHNSSGFTVATDYITGNGGAQNNVWKWVNASEFNGGETPVVFSVDAGSLTQTFELGAREDGLDIDKFAFAPSSLFYTVSKLDNGEPGVTEIPAPPEPDPIAKNKIKFLGSAYSNSQLAEFNQYWNQVTPENAGKWGSVEGTRDVMNWTALDAAYALAKDNGFPFKFHVFIWGNQQPAWIETLSAADQLDEIKEWYQAVAERYPDIDYIEVVNEPLHDPPNQAGSGGGNYINALGGSGTSGWDWILTSFRLAREYFPNAKLMLNDYGIINDTGNINQYKIIINLLLEEGLIDQVGIQAHAFSVNNLSSATIKSNLDALATTGLPIYVTELDIDGLDDAVQLSRYQTIFPAFWEHPSVAGITLWGYLVGHWREAQGAILINANGTERPSLVWLKDYVSTTVDVLVNSISLSSETGSATIFTKDGKLKIQTSILPANASLKVVEWSVDNSDVATINSAGQLTAAGDGTVNVTATALDGSGITKTITVTVSNQEVVTALSDDLEKMIGRPYPNPSSNGRFTLKGIDRISDVIVYDTRGVRVKELKLVNQPSVIVDLDASPGLYVIQLFDGKKFTTRNLILK